MNKRMPGKLAHGLSILLTLLMTLTLLLCMFSWQGVRLLTDSDLHHSIASATSVTDAQMERIQAAIDEIAAEQPIQPETLTELITPDAIRTYSIACSDWWMGLVQAEPTLAAPEWDAQAIEDAVREDELFQENVRSTLRRATARDQIAYPLAQTIQETVMPLRTQLISFVLPEVLERVDVPALLTLAAKVPMLCLAASGVLALLILLLMYRCPCKGGLYIGSALAAAALLVLLMMLGIAVLNPASLVAQANSLLALQLSLLLKQLAVKPLCICISMLVIGFCLIALHQSRMRIRIVRSIAA